MAEMRFGNPGLILDAVGRLRTDRNGLATGRCRFKMPPKQWDLVPGWGMVHPYADFCHLETKEVIFGRGFWSVVCDFVGCEKEETEKVYGLRRHTQREPVETHPEFVEKIGGKPSTPQNGAIFVDATGYPTSDDKTGVFERFKILLDDGDKNEFAGMEGYLAPTNTTWTGRWTSRTKPSPGADVGKIDDSPPGSPPDYGEEFKWLSTGLDYETRGKSYSVSESWLLGMWIEAVYEKGA